LRFVGLEDDLRSSALGARFHLGNEHVVVRGSMITHPMFDRRDDVSAGIREGTLFSEVNAGIGAAPFGDTWVWVEYDLFRPVYDASSIFNIFQNLPRRDLVLRLERPFVGRLRTAVWSFIRFEDDSTGVSGSQEDGTGLSGVGGGASALYADAHRELNIRFNLQTEWGETLSAIDFGGGRHFSGQRLWLGLRGIIRLIRDEFSIDWSGPHIGGVATLRFRIAKMAHVIGEFENFHGGGLPARFAGMAWLRLDLWR
jgi:hypothetical protein